MLRSRRTLIALLLLACACRAIAKPQKFWKDKAEALRESQRLKATLFSKSAAVSGGAQVQPSNSVSCMSHLMYPSQRRTCTG